MIASDVLQVKDTAYSVMIYTKAYNCPIDAAATKIYVQGFGSVYHHALIWRNFGVLHSTNDSINQLISLFVAKGLQLATERERQLQQGYAAN